MGRANKGERESVVWWGEKRSDRHQERDSEGER